MTDDPDRLRQWLHEAGKLADTWGPWATYFRFDARLIDAVAAVLDACDREDPDHEGYGSVTVQALREGIAESLDWNGGDWHG